MIQYPLVSFHFGVVLFWEGVHLNGGPPPPPPPPPKTILPQNEMTPMKFPCKWNGYPFHKKNFYPQIEWIPFPDPLHIYGTNIPPYRATRTPEHNMVKVVTLIEQWARLKASKIVYVYQPEWYFGQHYGASPCVFRWKSISPVHRLHNCILLLHLIGTENFWSW